MYLRSVKDWHRFWQKKRQDVSVICVDNELLSYPLFGKVFDRHAFFERVLKHYSGILILREDTGFYVVSRKYIVFVPANLFDDYNKTCENDQIDIQLLFDTLIKRFMKEV